MGFVSLIHIIPILTPLLSLAVIFFIKPETVGFWVGWLMSWFVGEALIVWLAKRLRPEHISGHRGAASIALVLPMSVPLFFALLDVVMPLTGEGGHAPIGAALGRVGLAVLVEIGCLLCSILMGIWGVIRLARRQPYLNFSREYESDEKTLN